jgi:phosphatidylglycerol---prolipoprotein diacylglyceryl transferase
MALQHPNIDPVIIKIWGPLQVRWYSLLYVGAFLVGGVVARKLSREDRFKLTQKDAEELPMWVLLGAVVGARIIYCLVYDPRSLIANPLYLFQVYKGGLSFHGGLIGVMTAAWLFARKKSIPYLNLLDLLALCTPIGLGMGRVGNFINGELWGRPTDVPWGMVFRGGGPEPRHPSQLYELFLEGFVLMALLWGLRKVLKKDGQLAIAFLLGYSVCRFAAEFFREPDAHIGYLSLGLSMGQWLCVIMFFLSAAWGWILHIQSEKSS